MIYYRAINATGTLYCFLNFLIFFVGYKCEAFVAIPSSLFIYPPKLGGPTHLPSATSHAQYCPYLSFSPSKGRSESFNEQQLRSLKEELLKKKAEVEKEMKVLEGLKQMALDKSGNDLLPDLSIASTRERRRNSSFLDGLSTHVLQGDNGAMGLKALALRNGMNSTEADMYIAQVKHSLHLLEISENIPALREEKSGYSSWLSNETPTVITSCQSFHKIESMWIEALHANDTRMMVLLEELWDMLTTQTYSELLDYGLGLGIPYQDGVTLATWAEKSLSNTQEGEVMWTNVSSETTKNIFIKAAAYVLGGLSICTRLNFKPVFNTVPASESYDFLNIASPSSEPPYHEVFNPSDNELLLKQQFGIKKTARLKLGIGFHGKGNIPPDTFTHSEAAATQGIGTALNISKRKCPRETMLGLLAVETACIAYGANALLNATNESWLEGKPTEIIAVEALEACMMRPAVSNVLYRLGLTPLEMENKEFLKVSACSPDDVRLFRSIILRDDLFEPFPKAVPFNERSASSASMDLSEIGYSELSPGTCSTGNMMPCLGVVVFKGRWKLTPEEVNAKLRKRLEDDSTGLNDRVEVLFWSDEFSQGSGGYAAATRASSIRGWISWAIAELETALLKDATLAIEMRGDLSDALESIETAMRSRVHSRYTAVLLPKPLKLQGPPKIPFGLAVGTAAATLGAFSCGMQSIPAVYAPTMLTIMASVQAVHELGHVLVAKRNGFDKAVPNILPIPSPTLGISGTALWPRGMMSSQDAAFEMYMAGPITGLLAACTALLAGLFLGSGSGEAVGLPINVVQTSWLVSKFLDFTHPGWNILTDMASNPLLLHPLAAGGIAALHMQALQGLCVVGSDISAARKIITRSLEKGEDFKRTLAFNFMSGSLPLIGNCAALYAALLKHNWVPLWYTITLSAIFQNDEWRRSRCRSDVGLTNIPTKFSVLAMFHIVCVLLIIPISTSSFLGSSST